jgi:hypothetical protein
MTGVGGVVNAAYAGFTLLQPAPVSHSGVMCRAGMLILPEGAQRTGWRAGRSRCGGALSRHARNLIPWAGRTPWDARRVPEASP